MSKGATITLPLSNYEQLVQYEEEYIALKRALISDKENTVLMQAVQQQCYDPETHTTFYTWREIVKNTTIDVKKLIDELNTFEKRFHDMENKLFELQQKDIPFSIFSRKVKDL